MSGSEPLRAWQAYLVNFLFWTGLSFGAILFVAVLNLTGAKWGRPLKRPAEALGAFLPCAFLLFWLLYFGRVELFPWITTPAEGKEAWLSAPFLFIRNGAGLLFLTIISLAMVRCSLRADLLWKKEHHGEGEPEDANLPDSPYWRKQQVLSTVFAIAYAFIMSFVGFDLVMSLDPHWYSTLFGAYFLVASFYTGLVALFLLTLLLAGSTGFRDFLLPRHFHDMGKMVFAFCLFTGYLFYAQFLTIWYGNLPEETRYVILRVKLTPWEPLAWVVLFMIFLVPFFILLSRKVKTMRLPMILLSIVIILGMWLERLILVAPSLWKGKAIPLGVPEILITIGFFGVMAICVTLFLRKVPLMPVSDPLFRRWLTEEKRLEP
ncbi:MAG TPA: NrfD/PsrC family molybdoenzyme membrane anchor subunit [Syntrophorhabdaceae bacterium]